MSGQQRQWGLTPPISTAPPTSQEIALNNTLIEELKAQKLFVSNEELTKRQRVLGEIQVLAREFVYSVSIQKKMTEEMARAAGGKIFTFGSYRLGVFAPDADIDTLLVAPKHVTRDHYFSIFMELLRAKPVVTDITSIPDAYVPIINFKYEGVDIDLSFASISQSQVPLDLELSDSILNGLDDTTIKSINGTRVADTMLKLVPNSPVFKHALRTIKLWATRRALHQNKVGFLGGVAWAILVARICQLYPTAVSGVIVAKFFRILSSWPWPQPVQLNQIEDHNVLKVWNPKLYGSDRGHKLPIITPAYPAMCATHNITDSTKAVIIKELKRAGDLTDHIALGKDKWSALFQKHTFFHDYRYYIVITAASRTAEAQLRWAGLVQSKVRILVGKLELTDSIALARPYVKGINLVHYCEAEDQVREVANGARPANVRVENLDLAKTALKGQADDAKLQDSEGVVDVKEGPDEKPVFTTNFYIGLDIEHIVGGSKQLDISWPSQEFFEKCRMWEPYDANGMNVCLSVAKGYELPDELFEEGETKPIKPMKAKRKRIDENAADQEDLKKVRGTAQASA